MTKLEQLLEAWVGGAYVPPVAALVGFRLERYSRGEATAVLDVEPRHHNPMGSAHGGVIVDVADGAMGAAVASVLQEGQSFSTVELHARYLKAVRAGTIRAEAKVIQEARAVIVVECEVRDEGGALLAKLSSTCAVGAG